MSRRKEREKSERVGEGFSIFDFGFWICREMASNQRWARKCACKDRQRRSDKSMKQTTVKNWVAIVGIIALIILAVLYLMPSGVIAYSGPSIAGNLRRIQSAKDALPALGNTNEWPTADDLFGSSSGRRINEIMRHPCGEIYFINRTGAAPFAYVPKARRGFGGGEILVLRSNRVVVVRQ